MPKRAGRKFRVDPRALCDYRLHAHFQNGEGKNPVLSQDRTRGIDSRLPNSGVDETKFFRTIHKSEKKLLKKNAKIRFNLQKSIFLKRREIFEEEASHTHTKWEGKKNT